MSEYAGRSAAGIRVKAPLPVDAVATLSVRCYHQVTLSLFDAAAAVDTWKAICFRKLLYSIFLLVELLKTLLHFEDI